MKPLFGPVSTLPTPSRLPTRQGVPFLALAVSAFLAISASKSSATVVTAYDNAGPAGCKACCGKGAKLNRTADGHRPVVGVMCAANGYPFGTRLRIEGVGVRVVRDRIAVRFKDRVDIFTSNHKAALRFGKRELRVEVVK